MSETSSEPELPATGRRRWRHWRRWVVVLWAVAMLWYGWREYTYHRAIRTIEAAGYMWIYEGPGDLIRKDWRALFRKETWEEKERHILPNNYASSFGVPVAAKLPEPVARPDLEVLLAAIQRLEPTELMLTGHPELRNLDGLKGLNSLRKFTIDHCKTLQNLHGLRELRSLKILQIAHCDVLHDLSGLEDLESLDYLAIFHCGAFKSMDALKKLPVLRELCLFNCANLENVKALQGLTSLNKVIFGKCPNLSKESVAALRAALPQAEIKVE